MSAPSLQEYGSPLVVAFLFIVPRPRLLTNSEAMAFCRMSKPPFHPQHIRGTLQFTPSGIFMLAAVECWVFSSVLNKSGVGISYYCVHSAFTAGRWVLSSAPTGSGVRISRYPYHQPCRELLHLLRPRNYFFWYVVPATVECWAFSKAPKEPGVGMTALHCCST